MPISWQIMSLDCLGHPVSPNVCPFNVLVLFSHYCSLLPYVSPFTFNNNKAKWFQHNVFINMYFPVLKSVRLGVPEMIKLLAFNHRIVGYP
ncbi:hypothetical protein FKM82_018034 [Ascaphus truei]